MCFTGNAPYSNMVGLLSRCDIAINPITRGAAQSIINKHGDYAMAGLPVVSAQESYEYRDLVEHYNMGFTFKCEDSKELAETFKILIENESLRYKIGRNSRICAEKRFDRQKSYIELCRIITNELEKK